MVKISVIVPVYNVESYLRTCVDSILGQTYPQLEILLVNDGSTDACPAICDQYAKADSRIVVIHKKNGGLSDARNAGLAAATGEYIGFVDSDDYIETDMYEVLLHNAVTHQADISCCRYSEVYADGSTKDYGDNTVTVYCGQEGVKAYLLGKTMDPFVGNKLYAAHLFKYVRFIEGIIGEDNPANYALFLQARTAVLQAQPKYKYRQNRVGAITQQGVLSQKKVNAIYNFEAIYRHCREHCPDLVKYVIRRQALFYIGMYNKIALYGQGFEHDKAKVRCFLQKNKQSILASDIAENQLKAAVYLLCSSPRMYELAMRVYKKIFKVARI